MAENVGNEIDRVVDRDGKHGRQLVDDQRAGSRMSYASARLLYANLRLLAGVVGEFQPGQARFQRAEHFLQLGELSGAVAAGDGRVDRFR